MLWSDLEKLRWKAGVVLADTNSAVEITLNDSARFVVDGHPVPGIYGIQVGGVSSMDDYQGLWTYLNGVEVGIRAMLDSEVSA